MEIRPPIYAWLLLAVCLAAFLVRGPIRAVGSASNIDAPLILSAAETWVRGGNPYDPESVRGVLSATNPKISDTVGRGAQAFVYSPPAYSLIGTLTYLPWSEQLWVWDWLNALLIIPSLCLICKICGIPICSLAGFSVLGIGLISNPGQLNSIYGQTGILTLFLMVLSWFIAPGEATPVTRGNIFFGALAMGIAAIIKPQIVLVFAILDFFSSRRLVAIFSVAVAGLLFLAAIAIHGDSVHIIESWLSNMHALMLVDANPLTRSAYHSPHLLINLQSPLAVLTGERSVATNLAAFICLTMAAYYSWIARRRKTASKLYATWLNSLSAASVMMLLIFYHRTYDAVFLMIPVAFAITSISKGDRAGWVMIVLLTLPLTASYSYVFQLLYPSSNPAYAYPFAPPRLIEAFVIQHQTWLLIILFFVLCEIRRRADVVTGSGVMR